MASIDSDMITRESMGARRYGSAVDLPLHTRMRVRLGRAIENALRHPQRCMPTLRRTIHAALPEPRVGGLADGEIVAKLGAVAEEIAREKHLDAASIVSGRPRWQELHDRMAEWIAAVGESPA